MENSSPSSPAIVLLSGGLDSATCLALAWAQGFTPYCLSFRYGQRHTVELDAARKVAAALGAERHLEVSLDLGVVGGSALTSDDLDVPKDRPVDTMEERIPVTYVPARNTLFLSYALAWAEVISCTDLFIGVNALDYSGYPDCRPEFVRSFEAMARTATRLGTELDRPIRVHAPLMDLTKAQIIACGLELGVDYGLTHSCYDPDDRGRSCGRCDACQLRLKGFAEAGAADPIPYQ